MFGSSGKKSGDKTALETPKVPGYAWRTCIFLCAGVLLVLFVHTSLSPALPLFVSEFNISYTLASWALTAYMVSGAVMTIIIGCLADLVGARKMLLVEMSCFVVGTALAGFTHDFYTLLVCRVIQGVAVANTPLAMKIVREQFPKEKFPLGASLITASFSGGMVLGLLFGAEIVGSLGWRYVFYLATPIALALLLIAWRYIGRHRGKKAEVVATQVNRADESLGNKPNDAPLQTAVPEKKKIGIPILNTFALGVSLASFLLAITFAGTIPTTTALFIGFLGLGIASIAAFFILERRTPNPLINPKVMFTRLMIVGNLIFLFAGILEYIIFQATPTLATAPSPSGFGLPVSASGLVQIPYAAMVIVFGLFSGMYSTRHSPLRLLLPGVAISVTSVALLFFFHGTFIQTLFALTLLGIGFTLIITAASITMVMSNPLEFTGLITSTTTDLRVIGGAIGPVIAGTFMSLFVVPYEIAGHTEYYPSPTSFYYIFLTALIVAVVQALLVIRFRQRALKFQQARQTGGATAAA